MKNLKYLLILFILPILGFSNYSTKFSTACRETFHFFFLTKGENPAFWIGIDLSGECYSSILYTININDSSITAAQLKDFKNWEGIPELKSVFETYEESKIESRDGIWIYNDIRIKAPEYDSTLTLEFNEHVMNGGGNAFTWYKQKDGHGLILPEIEGVNAELIFRYSRGLYFNYEISEMHMFGDEYLLIFTHQPRLAVGDDSMHGFLIFKVNKSYD